MRGKGPLSGALAHAVADQCPENPQLLQGSVGKGSLCRKKTPQTLYCFLRPAQETRFTTFHMSQRNLLWVNAQQPQVYVQFTFLQKIKEKIRKESDTWEQNNTVFFFIYHYQPQELEMVGSTLSLLMESTSGQIWHLYKNVKPSDYLLRRLLQITFNKSLKYRRNTSQLFKSKCQNAPQNTLHRKHSPPPWWTASVASRLSTARLIELFMVYSPIKDGLHRKWETPERSQRTGAR